MLFPFEKPRIYQEDFMKDIEKTIDSKKILIAHAPTGIGKTAAVLSVIIPKLLNSNLKAFFITPRNIQHKIVIDTIKLIEKKYNIYIPYQDIVGKKNLCLKAKDNVDIYEYCRILRENNECEYYKNSKNINIVERDINDLLKISKKLKVCPYEIALKNIKNSKITIGNYNHIFNSNVRNYIFSRGNLSFENLLLVVDEAQNLPKSISNMYSKSLSIWQIENALNEAKKYSLFDIIELINNLKLDVSKIIKHERIVKKDELSIDDYSLFLEYGDRIRKEKGRSYIGSIGDFLEMWSKEIDGFKRISYEKKVQYICVDPSYISKEIFENIYSGVLMGGTLKPLRLYRDILGINNSILREYKNPFPIQNRRLFVIPKTTTRYSERNEREFEKIGNSLNEILEKSKGSGIIFFPSYEMMKNILKFVKKKDFLVEKRNMSHTEKEEYLNSLKKGNILFAVMRSNFYEGIDIPNVLNFIVIVGLPLPKPDIKTKITMEYFERKFGNGFKYAYLLPTANIIRQAIGRMIRNENDKGVAILIDKRYKWKKYKELIPDDWIIFQFS